MESVAKQTTGNNYWCALRTRNLTIEDLFIRVDKAFQMAVSQGDVIRIAVRMQGTQSQDIINVWHIRVALLTSGVNADVVDDIIAELATSYQDLEPCLSISQTSVDMSIQNLTTQEVLGTHAWPTAFAGTVSGDALPPQTSLFSIFRTGISRRIGRKFLGIVAESSQVAGLVSGTVTTQMAVFLAHFIGAWIGGTTGNTYWFGVYNANMALPFADFEEAMYKSRLMIQRRRRPQVGS